MIGSLKKKQQMWYTERKQRGKSEISRVALRINKKCAQTGGARVQE